MMALCLLALCASAMVTSGKHQRCGSEEQDVQLCNASMAVARDHRLLQSAGKLSLARVAKHGQRAPGEFEFDDGQCRGMQDVERVCSANGCKVLATQMRGKTCNDFCRANGRSCLGAWEEVDETCSVLADMQCDQTWGDTSDLICECSEGELTGMQCIGMHDVELTCSTSGCKVLADNMLGKTCREYCGENGLACVGAWEEVNEDCSVKETLTCDQTWPLTSDLLCECAPAGGTAPSPGLSNTSSLRLVWSDDFQGTLLDASKWTVVRGGGGFGNQEQQFYTDQAGNIRLEQGVLRITAKCDEYSGHHFTSAKLQSKHKGEWGPGHRIDVRARLPQGKGTWPAIWMLPVENSYGRWPHSGEIDIMEAVGCTQNKVYGTVHTGAYNHMKNTEKHNSIGIDIASWHVYSIEWSDSQILWFVDGRLYHRFAPSSLSSDKWPFDQRFFLILNLAVGGSWGGKCIDGRPSCRSSSEFGLEQVMEVDYAHVYAL